MASTRCITPAYTVAASGVCSARSLPPTSILLAHSSDPTSTTAPMRRALRPVTADGTAWRAALPGATWSATATSSLPALVVLQDALGAAVEPLLDPKADVDLIRLAVVDIDIAVAGVVAVGERPSATAAIVARAAHELGTTTTVRVDVDVEGRRVVSVSVTYLARAPRRREDPAAVANARADDDARFAARPLCFVDDVVLAADAPAALARACGNDDPVSFDVDVARMAGLPAPIVPLVGVVALVWDALLRHVDGAHVVSRLRVTPLRPLLGGDVLHIEARGGVDHDVDSGGVHVRVQHAPASPGEGIAAVVVVEFT